MGNIILIRLLEVKIKNVRKKHCEQHVFLLLYYKINAAFGKKVNIMLILKYDSIIY